MGQDLLCIKEGLGIIHSSLLESIILSVSYVGYCGKQINLRHFHTSTYVYIHNFY